MVASEPGFFTLGIPQTLLDTPGNPGMSGSPVYRSSRGFRATREEAAALRAVERGEKSALDVIESLSSERLSDETVALTFVGVYAGAIGEPRLEELKLGRMFLAILVDLMVTDQTRGENPYPPSPHTGWS
jgi:hypothetical protein